MVFVIFGRETQMDSQNLPFVELLYLLYILNEKKIQTTQYLCFYDIKIQNCNCYFVKYEIIFSQFFTKFHTINLKCLHLLLSIKTSVLCRFSEYALLIGYKVGFPIVYWMTWECLFHFATLFSDYLYNLYAKSFTEN